MKNSLRAIRKEFWMKLIWVAVFLFTVLLSVIGLFWRLSEAHLEMVMALGVGFSMVFAGAVLGFIYLNEKLITPLIDLGRAARAQKLLGIPLRQEIYHHTMISPLASILAHHEEGDLERANTDDAREWAHRIGDRPLRSLNFTVFDTETTGLNPKDYDEIIQIGAVRVKRGKLDLSDYFTTYVDPARPIPKAATKIHGIDAKRVMGAPSPKEACQRFHDWSSEDVLVAHNAAFDMAFLRKTGVVFDHYVLDTVFMSAFLFDHTGDHTLDALAHRLHVRIPDQVRHDAHGDAVSTAEIFVILIPLLEERGVVTLDDVVALGQKMRRIRRAQAVYG